jgi:hypothetical protein
MAMAGRFHIRTDARPWLKNVVEPLGSQAPAFEVFYLCVLAGLTAGRTSDANAATTSELVENFPAEYASRGRLIVGLFLTREIKRRGIRIQEREPLHRAIAEFVDPRTPSQLSDAGVHQLNRYGYGGFEQLLEWFPDKPADLETFLPMFHAKINLELNRQNSPMPS